jgi:hypothetical protein
MPQTRFVTRKALALGLNAIVVNKIDRRAHAPTGSSTRPSNCSAGRHRSPARFSRDLRLRLEAGPAPITRAATRHARHV